MLRKRTRGERGAVAVEAALVTPILVLLLFGIIEMSLLMRDAVALSSAVRTGGRTASAMADAGASGPDELGDCVAPCTGNRVPRLSQLAANAIQRAGSAMPKDSIRELWIYHANAEGYPGTDGNKDFAGKCITECIMYKWNAAKDAFRYYSGSWDSTEISACANQTPDSVGVYIEINHSWITGMFGDGKVIGDHSVFTFEPLPTLTCDAGDHE